MNIFEHLDQGDLDGAIICFENSYFVPNELAIIIAEYRRERNVFLQYSSFILASLTDAEKAHEKKYDSLRQTLLVGLIEYLKNIKGVEYREFFNEERRIERDKNLDSFLSENKKKLFN